MGLRYTGQKLWVTFILFGSLHFDDDETGNGNSSRPVKNLSVQVVRRFGSKTNQKFNNDRPNFN